MGAADAAQKPSVLAYTRTTGSGEPVVWVASGDGTNRRRVGPGTSPAVSPDGRWVAWVRCPPFDSDCGRVLIAATAGGRPRELLMRSHGLRNVVWSPDSRRLLVGARRSLRLFDTAGLRRIVARGGYPSGQSFSPDGHAFVFAMQTEAAPPRADLFRSSVESPAVVRLTRDGRSMFPVWGPRWIAFRRHRMRGGWPAGQIWLMRPDGSRIRQLTRRPLPFPGAPGLEPVAWSADGSRLLAGFATEFDFAPYAVDPRTGSARAIGRFPSTSYALALSRDGRFVLASTYTFDVPGTEAIVEVAYEGGRGKVLVRRAGTGSWNR